MQSENENPKKLKTDEQKGAKSPITPVKQELQENNKNDEEEREEEFLKQKIDTLKNAILASSDESTLADSINALSVLISAASKSMTSIPKPLKFAQPFFYELKSFYDGYANKGGISLLADILSCVGMVVEDEKPLYCLKYKLMSDTDDISLWGHEYVKHLSREIIAEYNAREDMLAGNKKITNLIKLIVEFDFNNGAEAEAVDLLLEVDALETLLEKTDEATSKSACNYLLSCQQYIPSEMSISDKIFETAFALHLKHARHSEALHVALICGKQAMIEDCFAACEKPSQRCQIALIAGAMRRKVARVDADERISPHLGNEGMSKWFAWLSKELNVSEPKQLEDIYKSHLIDRSTFNKYESSENESARDLSSARENLAATFVNAFVHAGFGQDTLLSPEDSSWVFKNKGLGIASAAASMGLIHLWDLENGFQAVDRFAESSDANVKAGALLGFGLVGCGVSSELDASTALLQDHFEDESNLLKLFATIGTGISSASTSDADLIEPLDRIISNYDQPELCAFACLSLGLIFIGSCEDAAVESILEALIHFSGSSVPASKTLMMSVGLALIFFGANEKSEGIYEALDVLGEEGSEATKALVFVFAHAGSGNVLHLQETLKMIDSKLEEKADNTAEDTNKAENKAENKGENKAEKTEERRKEKAESDEKKTIRNIKSAIAVIGVAMIAMGEKSGKNMAYRIYDDLLRYEGVETRRAVPLGLALLFISRPDYSVIQVLSKLSHDPDEGLALNAILALGVVAAGTNNSRVSKMLRNLAVYYQKDADHLLITRISQGLVHCGKGLTTLDPYHFDGTVLNRNALAGLLIVFLSCIDIKSTILSDKHYILYYLSLAMRPRMLITVDEALEPLTVPVRVGQAIDSVRFSGEAKAITGFQTQHTPVLLSSGEKAELGTKKYIALTSYLEGIVILKPNPDFEGEEEAVVDE